MSTNRIQIVEDNLDAYLAEASAAPLRLDPDSPVRPGGSLTARQAVELFEDQVLSRSIDVAARVLKNRGLAYYTISSAGHEQNAIVGAQLRLKDPCFLHYRSGALMMARARKLPGSTPLFDTLLSLCASAEDPVSGGRHKVWGSREQWVPPQTSTIASHVPKAVGLAYSLGRARRLGIDTELPRDAIVACSFGDASSNHATALAGINSARYSKRRGNPTPVLFICEDNGRGISVETPRRWVNDFFSNLPHLDYFEAKGEVDDLWDTIARAIDRCRTRRVPVFLHLRCIRLWGHAGSDLETAYRSVAQIEAVEAKDPLCRNARRLVETGASTPADLRAIVADTRARVQAASEHAAHRRRIVTVEEVTATLAPYDEERVRSLATCALDEDERRKIFGKRLPEEADTPGRRTLAAQVNAALHDAMIQYPELLVFGEDVGRKGGVYGVTQHLQQRFREARCFDTLLDETTILGVAQGSAYVGFLPVPEIPYLAYLHNALDQLRGEACSLSFFSSGQFQNPMVVRIASFAYQKGFGGHFHNDNSIGALRDIPGLMLVAPARGDDAVRLMRGALATAKACGRVVCFLEPIALYHERDLHEQGDGGWLSDYPVPDGSPESAYLPGQVGLYGAESSAADLLIVSYANGLRLSLRAARRLEREAGRRVRVLDLRWLAPLPIEKVRAEADAVGRVLIVDECRKTGGGVAESLVSELVLGGYRQEIQTVCGHDSYIPIGPAANLVLVEEDDILAAALEMLP